jgi:hypothetical protein
MSDFVKKIDINQIKSSIFELSNIYVTVGAGAVIGAIAGGIIYKLKNR